MNEEDNQTTEKTVRPHKPYKPRTDLSPPAVKKVLEETGVLVKVTKRDTRYKRLTMELTNELCKVIKAGNTIKDACAYNNLSYRTFTYWFERGRDVADRIDEGTPIADFTPRERRYYKFYVAVDKARAEAVIELEVLIRRAAVSDWRAGAWLIERIAPKDWSRTTKQEINQTNDSNVTISVVYEDAAQTGRAGAAPQIIEVHNGVRELPVHTDRDDDDDFGVNQDD